MNKFVIIHNETFQYVTTPGSKHSYSDYLENAQTFATRELAEQNCCGNEHVGSIGELISYD